MIGLVGSDDKIPVAKSNHCDHVINFRKDDFAARVKDITKGEGVDVVYDSIDKDTFPATLDCLKPMGMWVDFGYASGMPPPFSISLLHKGSLFATRPTVSTYVAKRPALEASAHELFDALRSGKVRPVISRKLPLKDVAEAHRAIEGRETVGATVLIP